MGETASQRSEQMERCPPCTEDQGLVVLKKVQMVAMWSFAGDTENCGICKQSNHGVCINCEIEEKGTDQCDIAIGECNHAFHWHCIEPWLRKKTSCPICGSEWNLANRIERPA